MGLHIGYKCKCQHNLTTNSFTRSFAKVYSVGSGTAWLTRPENSPARAAKIGSRILRACDDMDGRTP